MKSFPYEGNNFGKAEFCFIISVMIEATIECLIDQVYEDHVPLQNDDNFAFVILYNLGLNLSILYNQTNLQDKKMRAIDAIDMVDLQNKILTYSKNKENHKISIDALVNDWYNSAFL